MEDTADPEADLSSILATFLAQDSRERSYYGAGPEEHKWPERVVPTLPAIATPRPTSREPAILTINYTVALPTELKHWIKTNHHRHGYTTESEFFIDAVLRLVDTFSPGAPINLGEL